MAGKSTLMKAISLSLYLAHIGLPVAAEYMEFSVRDGLYTKINLPDNLQAGASHFYTEVLRVKEVANLLDRDEKLFVVFDELFRGTNVKDAYDGTVEIARGFSRKRNSQFIISTHIMEAGKHLSEDNLSIQYLYLPTQMENGKPIYSRILQEGISADRKGMAIIKNEHIIELLDQAIKNQVN
jgi:DNA mismatch repair ATPase MutS